MGRERRKWTIEEDALLREAVNKATQESRPLLWRDLAKSVPGRTNKDCRRRWCNTLAGDSTKGPWTESEDERLCHAVREHGQKWTRAAAVVGTRNSDQCSSHWSLSLNPDIDYSDWARAEDEKLVQGVQQHGSNWKTIVSSYLPNRTALALKNRYSVLRAKAQQAPGKPGQKSKPEARGWQPTDRSDEDEDDEDDEEEDEDEDEDNDEEGDASNESDNTQPLRSDWQQRQASNIQSAAQFPFAFPGASNIQGTSIPPSATVGPYGNEVQTPPPGLNSLSSDSLLRGYQQSAINTFTPPNLNVNFGPDLNYTTSPDLHSHHYTDQSSGYNTRSPPQNPNSHEMQGVLQGGAHYSLYEDRARPGSWPSPISDSVAQQGHTPKRQRLKNQVPTPPGASPVPFKVPRPAPSSIKGSMASRDGSADLAMHRVSIDAECTNEQLGDLLRTLAGVTNKLVVKVDG